MCRTLHRGRTVQDNTSPFQIYTSTLPSTSPTKGGAEIRWRLEVGRGLRVREDSGTSCAYDVISSSRTSVLSSLRTEVLTRPSRSKGVEEGKSKSPSGVFSGQDPL